MGCGPAMYKIRVVTLAGYVGSLLLACASTHAEEDKFSKCPDPQAARQYVKECLAANPYKTKEVCEELALEKLCEKKK
jgi:hypothetical protein